MAMFLRTTLLQHRHFFRKGVDADQSRRRSADRSCGGIFQWRTVMQAADIMVTNVITVSPGQHVQEVAEILLKHRISGAPVVDTGGRLVGIISEGDLMRRAEAGTERHRAWWLQLLMGREGLAAAYIREHSRKVA